MAFMGAQSAENAREENFAVHGFLRPRLGTRGHNARHDAGEAWKPSYGSHRF